MSDEATSPRSLRSPLSSLSSLPPGRLRAALVTLSAPLVVWGLDAIPFPFADRDEAELATLTATAIGIAPFVTASGLVELVSVLRTKWRHDRLCSADDHRPRVHRALVIAAVLAVIQAFALHETVNWMEHPPSLWLTAGVLLAGTAAYGVAAHLLTRFGLVHGILAILASASVLDVVRASRAAIASPDETSSIAIAVVGGGVGTFVVAWLIHRHVRASTSTRRAEGYRVAPEATLPAEVELTSFPSGNLAITLPTLVGGYIVALSSTSPKSVGVIVAQLACTVALALGLGALFLRVRPMTAVWARASGRPENEVEPLVRTARSQALLRGALFAAGLTGLTALLSEDWISVSGLLILFAVAFDLRRGLAADAPPPGAETVWIEPRAWAVPAALVALHREGIAASAPDRFAASIIPLLGPLIPTRIVVAPADMERAHDLLADTLPPRPTD